MNVLYVLWVYLVAFFFNKGRQITLLVCGLYIQGDDLLVHVGARPFIKKNFSRHAVAAGRDS